MDDKKYIYSASRVKALESELLNEHQVERMVSAHSADEAYAVLNDTFLAPYIAGGTLEALPRALRKSLSATKRLIVQIAPEQEIFEVLWLHYDFYNLSVIVKGIRAGMSDEEIDERCYYAGTVTSQKLIDAVRKEQLAQIRPLFADVVAQAQKCDVVYDIDRIMNMGYFRAIRAIAQSLPRHAFVAEYVKLAIDLYNLRTQLRLLSVAQFADTARDVLWIYGGAVRFEQCATQEKCIEQFAQFGGVALWKEALDAVVQDKDFAQIERVADDYVAQFLKERANTITSPAPLFSYFLAHRNNIQIIKTIIVAKENDIPEVDLRKILRRLYK